MKLARSRMFSSSSRMRTAPIVFISDHSFKSSSVLKSLTCGPSLAATR